MTAKSHPFDANNYEPQFVQKNAKLSLIALIGLGIAIRIFLAVFTVGTNDMLSWEQFANSVKTDGLLDLYASNEKFNHPPLMGYLAVFLTNIASLLDVPFYVVFKMVMVFADCSIMAIFYRLWSRRLGPKMGWQMAAIYSLNVLTILITGYHGNTDILYCLTSLGALLLANERRMFLSGLVLAAGLNVKLIPVVLVMPFLTFLNNKKELIRWGLGFGLGILPLLAGCVLFGEPFVSNVLRYRPWPDNWGFIFLFRIMGAIIPNAEDFFLVLLQRYLAWGPIIILSLVAALSAYNRNTKKLSLGELSATSATVFIVFASGFGLQYFALLITLVFATEPRWGFRLSALTGLCAMVTYGYYLVSISPAISIHKGAPTSIALLYCLTWLTIIYFLGTLISNQRNRE